MDGWLRLPGAADLLQDWLPPSGGPVMKDEAGEHLHLQSKVTRAPPASAPPLLLHPTLGVCSSELWSSDEAKQKVGWVRFTPEQVQQMQKEMNHQERLLRGYQQVSSSTSSGPRWTISQSCDVWQENEKLYLELKAEKARSRAQQEATVQEQQRFRCRAQQEATFQEQQRLLTQLALSRSVQD